MTLARWTAAVAGCMLAMLANEAFGQTGQSANGKPAVAAAAAASARLSTSGGVYTRAQAKRGRYVYLGSCRSCHAAETHTGKVFEEWWGGKPLSELYTYILERMPKNDPGSLAPEDVADVTAYLLELNAMPAGNTELHPDVDSLRKFTVEVKRSGSGASTARGKQP